MSIGAKKCILFLRREEAPVSRCCALRLIRLIPPHCSATERAKRGAPPRRGQTIPVLPAWISRIPQLPLIQGYGISLEKNFSKSYFKKALCKITYWKSVKLLCRVFSLRSPLQPLVHSHLQLIPWNQCSVLRFQGILTCINHRTMLRRKTRIRTP